MDFYRDFGDYWDGGVYFDSIISIDVGKDEKFKQISSSELPLLTPFITQ